MSFQIRQDANRISWKEAFQNWQELFQEVGDFYEFYYDEGSLPDLSFGGDFMEQFLNGFAIYNGLDKNEKGLKFLVGIALFVKVKNCDSEPIGSI